MSDGRTTRHLDLTGLVYGNLTVRGRGSRYSPDGRKKGGSWICQCVCGSTCEAGTTDLKRGKYKSCGCLKKQIAKQNAPRRVIRSKRVLFRETTFDRVSAFLNGDD
jgi:hypothetical protein